MELINEFSAGLLYIGFAVVPLAIAVFSWQNREKPGATPLAVASVSAAAATSIQGLRFIERLLAVGDVPAILLHIAALTAVNYAVLGSLYIATEYTGVRWLSKRQVVVSLVVAATVFPILRIPAQAAELRVAPVIANVDFLYRLVLAVTALLLFGRQFLGARGVYRKQSGALLFGLVVGSSFGLLERFNPFELLNLTPLGMTLGFVILAWSLFRYELLETFPIARETLFDQVTDPVIALDGAGRVVDLNEAAYETFGVSEAILGTEATALFQTDETLASEYSDLIGGSTAIAGVVAGQQRHFVADTPVFADLREGNRPSETTVGLLLDGIVRYFQVSVSTLELAPNYEGLLVVFRDITQSKEREQDLDILKQVLTRVLRHNLRNDVSAIQGYANAIASETEGQPQHNAERIVAMTTNLTETSETARRIEDVIDADGRKRFDLDETLSDVVADVREQYPDATIEFDGSTDVVVSCNPQLQAALQEILENAIVHSGAEPRVDVTGERSGRWYDVVVSDDGPGIPDHELETLQQGEETALVHGSGAGLWLIQLVVEDSNGDVSYETDGDGTTVRVRLPVAENDSTE
jgi:signal transduction histidine kinase